MKTIGIIAEFNPFHNGHKYLIEKSKEVTGADNVLVIMSGNYVQRGIPSIIDKYTRANAALENGADVIFELPVVYSTASAELFARASVRFLNKLNCIDYLCFGCESENIEDLQTIANILADEPRDYKEMLNEYTKSGISFPLAREKALKDYVVKENIALKVPISQWFSKSNNILALEYLKAIKLFNSDIKPVAIKRIGEEYNSTSLDSAFASATGIRTALHNNENFETFVPKETYTSLTGLNISNSLVYADDFSTILGNELCRHSDYSNIYGINEDLSNRIANHAKDYMDFDSFANDLLSKNTTQTAINRALLHLILGITDEDMQNYIDNDYMTYGRLLGFTKSFSDLLSVIKENGEINIVSKLSTYYNNSTGIEKNMLDRNIKCDSLYRMIVMNKSKTFVPTEFQRQIIIK